MKFYYKSVVLATIAAMTFISCEKNEENESNDFSKGIFVSNEGAFGGDNATVSFIDNEGVVTEKIFRTTNDRILGDVLQSIEIIGEQTYLVVNNSYKVEVVNTNTFEEYGVISDLGSPRSICANNDKLYISQWSVVDEGLNILVAEGVTVVDKNTLEKIKTVSVGSVPEGVLSVNNEVWVANSGWGYGNTVSVIDVDTDEVKNTIVLDAFSPVDMDVDNEGDVWVLCSGNISYDPYPTIVSQNPSKLVEIDAITKEIKKVVELSESGHYKTLVVSNNNVYYGSGFGVENIYRIDESANTGASTPLIEGVTSGFNVDEEGRLYVTRSPSYTELGSVELFSNNGEKISDYTVGIGPNGVVFN